MRPILITTTYWSGGYFQGEVAPGVWGTRECGGHNVPPHGVVGLVRCDCHRTGDTEMAEELIGQIKTGVAFPQEVD